MPNFDCQIEGGQRKKKLAHVYNVDPLSRDSAEEGEEEPKKTINNKFVHILQLFNIIALKWPNSYKRQLWAQTHLQAH